MTQYATASSPSEPSRPLLSSTGWLVAGRLVGSTSTFLILLQLARELELAEFGRLTFYMAVLGVLGSVVDMGTGQTIVQQSSRSTAALGPLLRTAFRLRCLTALGCWAGWSLWSGLAGEAQWFWLVATGATLFASPLELVSTPARNAMRLRAPVLIRASSSLCALAAVTLCLRSGLHAVGPLLFVIHASAATGLVIQHYLLRAQLPPRAPHGSPWRPYLKLTLPLGIGALCQQLYFWIDNALIRAHFGDTALGLYNLPVRLFSFAILVAALAPQAALPYLSRSHEQGQLTAALRRVSLPLLGLGAFTSGVIWVGAPKCLAWFGPEFPQVLSVMRILIVALFSVHIGSLCITGLIAAGRTGGLLWITATGLAINLTGNLLSLPTFGLEGAAWATAGTEVWVAGCGMLGLARCGCAPWKIWGGRTLFWVASAGAVGWGLTTLIYPWLP